MAGKDGWLRELCNTSFSTLRFFLSSLSRSQANQHFSLFISDAWLMVLASNTPAEREKSELMEWHEKGSGGCWRSRGSLIFHCALQIFQIVYFTGGADLLIKSQEPEGTKLFASLKKTFCQDQKDLLKFLQSMK